MGQPENKPELQPKSEIFTETNKPDVKKERYFRITVSTHPNESGWIFVHDTIHTPIKFHRDYEVILPEWAVNALRDTKITQFVARFEPFQKTVPYYPRITRRFIPEVLEEVTYADYVAFRDADAQKPLPGEGDSGSSSEVK